MVEFPHGITPAALGRYLLAGDCSFKQETMDIK